MTSAYKVTILVIDTDNIGSEQISEEMKYVNYPNDCVNPQVISVEGKDIGEFTDDHPLNHADTMQEAFDMLFSPAKPENSKDSRFQKNAWDAFFVYCMDALLRGKTDLFHTGHHYAFELGEVMVSVGRDEKGKAWVKMPASFGSQFLFGEYPEGLMRFVESSDEEKLQFSALEKFLEKRRISAHYDVFGNDYAVERAQEVTEKLGQKSHKKMSEILALLKEMG